MLAIYSLPVGLLIAGVLIGWIGFRATASLYAILAVFTVTMPDRGTLACIAVAGPQP